MDHKGPQTADAYGIVRIERVSELKSEDPISFEEVDPEKSISWREGLNIVKYWNLENMSMVLATQREPKYPLSNIKMTTRDKERINLRSQELANRHSESVLGREIDTSKILKQWISGEDVGDSVHLFLREGDFGKFYDSNRAGSLEERNLATKALEGQTPGHWLVRYCSLNDTVNELDHAFAISVSQEDGVDHFAFIRRTGWGIQFAYEISRGNTTDSAEFLNQGEAWESQFRYHSIFQLANRFQLKATDLITKYDDSIPLENSVSQGDTKLQNEARQRNGVKVQKDQVVSNAPAVDLSVPNGRGVYPTGRHVALLVGFSVVVFTAIWFTM